MMNIPSPNAERIGRAVIRVALVMSVAIVACAVTTIGVGAQAQPGIDEVLARVGQKIAEFYERAQHVICMETSTVQPIDSHYSPEGFSRTVESELRVETDGGDGAGDATVLRDVRRINGRAPRENDQKNRAGCTDPNPLSTEPLAFLLPAHRSEYQFKAAGTAKERNRPAFRVDFASTNRKTDLELIEDKEGHPDCFDWSGHVASRGRVWIDAETFDVLRVERNIGGPVEVKVPPRIQRRYNFNSYVVIMREDTTIRYKTVAFSDPDERLLLPESIDSWVVVSGGLQSTRRNQSYSDYRRFVTESRIVD